MEQKKSTPILGQRTPRTRYVAPICSYVYDPELGDPDAGVEPGTRFEDLPDNWGCTECGAIKDQFKKEE